ncbi:hypothetical protein QL996_08550 [Planococcus sp. APC 4015]|nr:hypothetical protein [Planococcus sp. APC 4015]
MTATLPLRPRELPTALALLLSILGTILVIVILVLAVAAVAIAAILMFGPALLSLV